MVTRFSGSPLMVTLTPRGSIHEEPSVLNPKGMSIPVPAVPVHAATEVTLPACSVTCVVTGAAMVVPAMGLKGLSSVVVEGSRSVPSQPSSIVPNGARKVPPCEILDAKIRRLPPAEYGAVRVPEPRMVTAPGCAPLS